MSKFSDLIEKVPGVVELETWFTSEEQLVMTEFQPLVAQIIASVNALGKATFAEGFQVLKDAASAAVSAGAAAALSGNPAVAVSAAEAAFLTTGASEGITAVHNAEAGLIKAAVAAAQTASATLAATPVAAPVEAPAEAPAEAPVVEPTPAA